MNKQIKISELFFYFSSSVSPNRFLNGPLLFVKLAFKKNRLPNLGKLIKKKNTIYMIDICLG